MDRLRRENFNLYFYVQLINAPMDRFRRENSNLIIFLVLLSMKRAKYPTVQSRLV